MRVCRRACCRGKETILRTSVDRMQSAKRPHGGGWRYGEQKAKYGSQLHEEARLPAQEVNVSLGLSDCSDVCSVPILLKNSVFTDGPIFAEALVRLSENYLGTSSSTHNSTSDTRRPTTGRLIARKRDRITQNEKSVSSQLRLFQQYRPKADVVQHRPRTRTTERPCFIRGLHEYES